MTERAAAGEASATATLPRVTVSFASDQAEYAPGDMLETSYRVAAIDPATITTVERSVVWYTEGKGEEDFGVVFFDRLLAGSSDAMSDEPTASAAVDWPSGSFSIRLPSSPLSYEGLIVKIRWCIRVRLFFSSGRDFVSEHVFFLGDIPVARPLRHAVS
ncbi:MAG: hypothetical protein EBS83_01305 [Planctomycetia bacterium]|jgi:hypothetical protein|nr:hypothetical protein [Planctomycetia bacterium]NDH92969.1 hypothetical protein [Planctomycetia bacterium]